MSCRYVQRGMALHAAVQLGLTWTCLHCTVLVHGGSLDVIIVVTILREWLSSVQFNSVDRLVVQLIAWWSGWCYTWRVYMIRLSDCGLAEFLRSSEQLAATFSED